MATQVISNQPWPDGTLVNVYPAAAWPDPAGSPSGTAVTSATVSSGRVTVSSPSLLEDVRYVAYAAGHGIRFLVPGTSGNSLLEQAQDLIASVSDKLGGMSKYLEPTGDVTGAQDLANINAALIGFESVFLHGDFTINSSIIIPSNTTLILGDAKVSLAPGSNRALIENSNMNATGNTQIHVRGVGRAIFDGNAGDQVRNFYFYKNTGIILVNVSEFSLDGLEWRDTNYSTFMFQASTGGRVTRTHIVQNGETLNEGAFECGPGCRDITIDGVTGTIIDDLLDCAAFQSSGNPGYEYVHPYVQTLTAAQRNTGFITIMNAHVSGQVMLRCLTGDGSSVSYVKAENISNRNATLASAALYFGPNGYTVAPPNPGDIINITFSGYDGACRQLVACDQHASNVQVSRVRVLGLVSLVGHAALQPSTNPALTDIAISDVQINGAAGNLSELDASCVVTGLKLKNIRVNTLKAVLKNACAVTGLDVSDIKIGTLTENPFQSTGDEKGSISDVSWRSTSGSFSTTWPSKTSLKLGQGMPVLRSTDTTPKAITGSRIVCDFSKDPTGAGGVTGGEYVGDGERWRRTVDLGGFNPGLLTQYPLLFHYDASQITGLSDTDPIPTVLDLSGNDRTLSQATAGKRPTWAQTVAYLNNKSAMRFDGTDDFLQSVAITAIPGPITIFAVFALRTVPTTGYVFDGAVSSASRIVIYKVAAGLAVYAGSGNVTGAVPSANTAYLVTGLVQPASSSDYIRVNQVTPISGTAGDSGITGVTLGADKAGATPAAVDVAEVFAYSGVMTVADLATAQNYMAAKYGITLGA